MHDHKNFFVCYLLLEGVKCSFFFSFRESGFILIELEPENSGDLGVTVVGYKTADGRYCIIVSIFCTNIPQELLHAYLLDLQHARPILMKEPLVGCHFCVLILVLYVIYCFIDY